MSNCPELINQLKGGLMVIIKQLPKKDISKVRKLIDKLHIYETKHFDDSNRIDKAGLKANYNFSKKELGKNKSGLFVALDGSKIIGFALGYIEKKPNRFKFQKLGQFFDLFVEENYRNKGIGEKLAKALLAWYKKQGITYIDIFAYAKNPSTNLYKRLGFVDRYVGLRIRLK
jgi:GNAT superfamily N-acetyltransferase